MSPRQSIIILRHTDQLLRRGLDMNDNVNPTNKKHQTFRLGETVRIISGPFVSFTGKIQGINQSKALLLVKVAIYGRNKPIILSFADAEVVSAS